MAVALSSRFKRVAESTLVFAACIGVLFLIFPHLSHKPQVHLKCRFTQSPSDTHPASHRGLVDQVEGRITSGEQDQAIANLDSGAASGGERNGGNVSGAIFQDKTGSISGLFLTVQHADFRGNDLRIATLNPDGQLDENRSEAFEYFEDQPDKRSYPVRYSCTKDQ